MQNKEDLCRKVLLDFFPLTLGAHSSFIKNRILVWKSEYIYLDDLVSWGDEKFNNFPILGQQKTCKIAYKTHLLFAFFLYSNKKKQNNDSHHKHFKFQSIMNIKYLDASNTFKPVNFVTMDKK